MADFATMLTLTLLEQGDVPTFTGAASMTTLNYTGKLLHSDAMISKLTWLQLITLVLVH